MKDCYTKKERKEYNKMYRKLKLEKDREWTLIKERERSKKYREDKKLKELNLLILEKLWQH